MNFLFFQENSPANPMLDEMIQRLQNTHVRTSATQRNEFKAFLYNNQGITAFALGRYPSSFLDNVSTYQNLVWTGILDWIETTNLARGQGLCANFLAQILKKLISLRIYHLQIINIGGQIACRCYVRAANLVGAIPCYFDGVNTFIRTNPQDCTRKPEVDLIILPDAARMHPGL